MFTDRRRRFSNAGPRSNIETLSSMTFLQLPSAPASGAEEVLQGSVRPGRQGTGGSVYGRCFDPEPPGTQRTIQGRRAKHYPKHYLTVK